MILQPDQTLVFEGDSLTRRAMNHSADNWPLLRMNNWHRSCAELVEEWLFAHRPDLRLKARHAAIGGSNIHDLHARYETQVKPHSPSWIIFTLGTNDCVIGLDVFEAELSRYLDTARGESGSRFLYVGGFEAMPGLGDARRAPTTTRPAASSPHLVGSRRISARSSAPRRSSTSANPRSIPTTATGSTSTRPATMSGRASSSRRSAFSAPPTLPAQPERP